MERSRRGFSVIEFLVGSVLLCLVLMATQQVLRPIFKAYKKSKILNAMIRVENQIREGVYIQPNYADLSQFIIRADTVIVAKHDAIYYVNEDLTASSTDPIYPIQTRLSVVTVGPPTQTGVIYQVSSRTAGVPLRSLGAVEWPETDTEKRDLMINDTSGFTYGASAAAIQVPAELAQSVYQDCGDGFMRGVSASNTVVCWKFQGLKQCPRWTLPVGYRLDATTSSIQVLCQKMNNIACPAMNMSYADPTTGANMTASMDNFFVLKNLVLSDLYPPRSPASVAASECERVIDFTPAGLADVSGVIPAANVVLNQNKCPDDRLYKKVAGACQPTFDLANIPTRRPASISSPVINLETATEARPGVTP